MLSWSVFPVSVVVILGAGVIGLERGVPAERLIAALFLTSVLAVASLERMLPYRVDWNRGHGDFGADAVYLPMTGAVNGILEPIIRTLAAAVGAWGSGTMGFGLWPTAWPLLGQFVLACVVAEFFDYFAHRVMHESPFLWRFHAVHHSAPRLYWLNATRAHPAEMLFRGTVGMLPLALLGAGEEVFVLLAVTNVIVGFFQHANIDFELGALSWIFSVGEMHRWHHSRDRTEADGNYGNNFLIWDAVFGTRYRRHDQTGPDALGFDAVEYFPRSLRGQLASPFRV
jgi:sterol desaturase/sphingolipid hydroxylase (fatty acid hydroxylase superfamily)